MIKPNNQSNVYLLNKKLYIVKWIDSAGVSSSWEYLDDFKLEPVICYSVGFKIFENENYIAICPHCIDETTEVQIQGCGTMSIPKKCILNIKEVKQWELGDKKLKPTSKKKEMSIN